ncbi:MAG: methyltransferase [Methylocapsa sp.]|nr:methyltransferase [Methylocapsa sp.]
MAELPQSQPRSGGDSFLGGRFFLRQPASGHRSGTDAVLLAAAAPAHFCGIALDAGAGSGAAGLALAVTRPGARVGLIEIDPVSAELARENIVQNGLCERCYVVETDLLIPAGRREAGLRQESAALVITNPPFLDPSRARLPPDPDKRRAHAMPSASALNDWIQASLSLVAPGGSFLMIHHAGALPEILQCLPGRAGGVTLLPIYPREGSKASRILLRATKGSRAPLAIAPPLVLHAEAGFTPLAEAIHRGEAVIEW